MVNKKGYLKTLEAVISIVIIVIVSYLLIPRPMETQPEVPPIVKGSQKVINQAIQLNETIRDLITLGKDDLSKKDEEGVTNEEKLKRGITAIINKYPPPGYDYTCLICQNPGTCLAGYMPLDRSIYMTDVLVASSEEQQNVRIVRIWFWRKPTSIEEQRNMKESEPPSPFNSCGIKLS